MRRGIAALAALASIVSAQDAVTTSIDIDTLSVEIPTTVFNLPVVYVTADGAPTVTATTLAVTATAPSDPLATDVFDSAADVSAAIASDSAPAAATSAASIEKRDGSCAVQPSGYGPVPTPDTPDAFLADSDFSNAANNAGTPGGYTQSFYNLQASNSAENYMGYTLLDSYNVDTCASKCNAISGCNSINIYFERDPSQDPGSACPNPPSTTQIKCVFWGGAVTKDNANNFGQSRSDFKVVIAGSNGYVNTAYLATLPPKETPPQIVDANGYVYNFYYSSDTNRGAYASKAATSSYKDCMSVCDADSKCKAFTYVGKANGVGSGTCWLKSDLGKPTSSGANVISAVRTGYPLSILSAYYSTQDVTSVAKDKFVKALDSIYIDTTDLDTLLGVDPWQGTYKTLSILYTNGTTTRVFVADQYSGTYSLSNNGANSAIKCVDAFNAAAPSDASIKIISAVWGKAQTTVQSTYTNLYSFAKSKSSFTATNEFFGIDTWPGLAKSAVVWYTSQQGVLSAVTAREYNNAAFP